MDVNDSTTDSLSLSSQSASDAIRAMATDSIYTTIQTERTAGLLKLCHSILTFISSTPSKLASCDSSGCVSTWFGCILGTAATAELISKALRSLVAILRSPEVRRVLVGTVKDGLSQKTYKMKWRNYCDWAQFCPAVSYMLPRRRWPNSRLGVSSIAPVFQQGQTQDGTVSVLAPDYKDEDGHPYRRISRAFVALHLGLFFVLAYIASSTVLWLGKSFLDSFAYGLAVLGLSGTFDNVSRMYTNHTTAMVFLNCALIVLRSVLKRRTGTHSRVQQIANLMTWRYAQVNSIFCLLAVLFQHSTKETRQGLAEYASGGFLRGDRWIQRILRQSIATCYTFVGRHIFTGLMFIGMVQAYYSKCKHELEARLLRNSASTLSNELRCSVKSRIDAEQEFQQKESKLSSDLSARDAELANLKAMVEVQAAELLEKFAQLEEDNSRLIVENGRLDISFEDRVQTEVDDRDQCIAGLKDKCERMKRELEEAERTVEHNALERAVQEMVLQELREHQEADRKRMNAVIEDLSKTLEELQAKWVAEKAQWEKEKEEARREREAIESKRSESQEELRLATEKFAEDRTAYRTQAQRLINDLNNEIRVACSQRKDADIAHKTIKEELVGVQKELRSARAAKKALERKVSRWEEEVKALDAMWKEVGLVSGRWETARALFTQLASQTSDFDRWVKGVEVAAQPNTSELELPQMDTPENPAARESTEISAATSGETSVYQIPAKRTPLLVSSSPVDIWPINEEQVPSWIPFPSEPTSVPTITRRPSFGGQGQRTLGHSASAERLTRGMNNVNVPVARDQVIKPAVRSGSGLRMCLGNGSSADLSPTDFGREIPRHAASASVPSESTAGTSAAPSAPRGSLFESMHAPRRMLVAPVVCETVASGGVTQTSGIFNVPGNLAGQARDVISFQAGTGRGFSGSH